MKLCIHRGTHQIGGIAAEISTASTRILIDMGDELSLDPNFVSASLNIPGVTDGHGHCDAVLFTQMSAAQKNLRNYMRQNCVSDEKSLVNKSAHTLLTGVCALCEADSPDSQMSGLFCVTPFRTRGCPPCDACASIPAHFAAETVCWCRPFPSQSLKIPYL